MSDFQQAIKWLKEGKKVRRKFWLKDVYWEHEYGSIFCNKGDNEPKTAAFDFHNIDSTDWEIVVCKDNNHNWEKHGCAAPLKHYFKCRDCDEEKFIYMAEERTLSDEIYKHAPGAVRCPDSISVEKVKEFIENIKRDMNLTMANAEIINKHAGLKLC